MQPSEAMKLILYPYVTEKNYDLIEKHNKIVFVVNEKANKNLIRQAVETLYGVKVASVNTAKTIIGKKAYVRLSPKSSATDLASKLGLV
jgi:large subunit ribosomal protein L23